MKKALDARMNMRESTVVPQILAAGPSAESSSDDVAAGARPPLGWSLLLGERRVRCELRVELAPSGLIPPEAALGVPRPPVRNGVTGDDASGADPTAALAGVLATSDVAFGELPEALTASGDDDIDPSPSGEDIVRSGLFRARIEAFFWRQ